MSNPKSEDVVEVANGLQTLLVSNPVGETFAASLALRVGSHDSPRRCPPLAHLAEHLAFSGKAVEVVEALASEGAIVNAYTASEHTEVHVQGHVDTMRLAMHLFGHVLTPQCIDEDELRREIAVLDCELRTNVPKGKSWRDRGYERYLKLVSGDPNWDLRLVDECKTLKRLSLGAIQQFRKAYYHLGNAALAIVASSSLDELQDLVHRTMSENVKDQPRQPLPDKTDRAKPFTFAPMLDSQAWLAVAHVTRDTSFSMRFAALLLSEHWGVGFNSELYQRLRRASGTAYLFEAYDMPFFDRTLLQIFVNTTRKNLDSAVSQIHDAITDLVEHGFTPQQLDTLRRQVTRRSLIHWEQDIPRTSRMAHQLLRTGEEDLARPTAWNERLSNLTLDEVNGAVRELLSVECRRIFVSGRLGPIAVKRIHHTLLASL